MANKKRKDVTSEFLNSEKGFQIYDFKFTEKQRELIKLLRDQSTKVVFIEGVAGTSKTFVATFAGLMALRDGSKSKLKYIRSLVESSQNKIGYLPGDISSKLNPYEGPLHDKLEELLSQYDSQKLITEGFIECVPVNFLRGSTFRNSFVLIDECQNISYGDLVTIITRIGENCTIVFAGDTMQCDIRNSGFKKLMNLFTSDESCLQGIHHFQFTSEHIMRSGILKYILEVLEKKELSNTQVTNI